MKSAISRTLGRWTVLGRLSLGERGSKLLRQVPAKGVACHRTLVDGLGKSRAAPQSDRNGGKRPSYPTVREIGDYREKNAGNFPTARSDKVE